MSAAQPTFGLGDRMKAYEAVANTALTRRMPMILRLDGRAFHAWTRAAQCVKPFDDRMHWAMGVAACGLAEDMQGTCLGYIQSDEASFVLQDWWEHQTEPWLGKRIQRVASIAASVFSVRFNACWQTLSGQAAPPRFAYFDARCFVLPEAEVCNYFVWRQRDAVRNSIAALARAHFSHKLLYGLDCDQMQELVWEETGINWSELPVWQKRGACIVCGERAWAVHDEPPMFSADREYVERRMRKPEEAAV